MKTLLLIAAFLAAFLGVAHTVLGERYVLIRLFRRGNLPKLYGGQWFTRRLLRFAWHLTSVAWWGFAVILWALAGGSLTPELVAAVAGWTFLVSGLITMVSSHGKHFAWPIFLFIGAVALYAAWG